MAAAEEEDTDDKEDPPIREDKLASEHGTTGQGGTLRSVATLAEQESVSSPSASGPLRAEAYYSRRTPQRSRQRPTATEVHWAKQPASASQIHAPVSFLHQAGVEKRTPHVIEGAAQRWPNLPHPVQRTGPADPLDDRRHNYNFGYREQRWKKHWVDPPTTEENVPNLSLNDIKLFLTKRFGSLKFGFKHLDFFEDGRLALIEWQEGLRNIFQMANGERYGIYRCACNPRFIFNDRMAKLFQTLDEDQDGYISFTDLAKEHKLPSEKAREFTNRKVRERIASNEVELQRYLRKDLLNQSRLEATSLMTQAEAENLSKEDPQVIYGRARTQSRDSVDMSPMSPYSRLSRLSSTGGGFGLDSTLKPSAPSQSSLMAQPSEGVDEAHELLRDFATAIFNKYPNLNAAFASFDDSNNGQLSMAEFVTGAKNKLRFGGCLKSVFKGLDTDNSGLISTKEFFKLRLLGREDGVMRSPDLTIKTKREVVSERQQRAGIDPPAALARSKCLAATHVTFPLGEKVSSSAGFYSFPRSSTGRLDKLLHPNELPGEDAEQFSPEHGPGFLAKGPEYHTEVGHVGHPRRGNGWKLGANLNKTPKFGPLIPTRGGAEDKECADASFITYDGRSPYESLSTSLRPNQLGATVNRSLRYGPTYGTDDSNGLRPPRPIGPWAETRLGVKQLNSSCPSLLRVSM
eukprot:TRINITY_DN122044_c0_g1_i1.p1 TRINITY_DN122044_c0_g1~~TRINITY_DN122044_c0_g1_i1.p1  ORF type:complete len:687 (+),score=164.61 TRINITY_DN122044_c0_g1_i1:104-2164(+)